MYNRNKPETEGVVCLRAWENITHSACESHLFLPLPLNSSILSVRKPKNTNGVLEENSSVLIFFFFFKEKGNRSKRTF